MTAGSHTFRMLSQPHISREPEPIEFCGEHTCPILVKMGRFPKSHTYFPGKVTEWQDRFSGEEVLRSVTQMGTLPVTDLHG